MRDQAEVLDFTQRLDGTARYLPGSPGSGMTIGKRFRQLQQQILSSGEDTSLFAWGLDKCHSGIFVHSPSILAPSPRDFATSGDVIKGFATQRILFEVTNRGMMVLIHRSFNRDVLNELLKYGLDYVDNDTPQPICMTNPLSCYREVMNSSIEP